MFTTAVLMEPVSNMDDIFPKYHSVLFNSLRHTQINPIDPEAILNTSNNLKQEKNSANNNTSNYSAHSHVKNVNNSNNHVKRSSPLKNSLGIEYKSTLFNDLITSQFDSDERGGEEQLVHISLNNYNHYMHYPSVRLSDVFSEEKILELNTLKLGGMFDDPVCNLETLRIFSAEGIPSPLRAMTWQFLVGYLSPYRERRHTILEEKRHAYNDLVKMYTVKATHTNMEDLVNLIRMDVERTLPDGYQALFAHPFIKKALAQILLVWGLEHPLTGYFQGLNDLATPFLIIFLENCYVGSPCATNSNGLPNSSELVLDESKVGVAEADAYWCLCTILDSLEHHNAYSKCGVHAESMMKKLERLIIAIDAPLDVHLKEQGIEYVHFAFRWMLCLFMRELSLELALHLWECYLTCENFEGFSVLHVYVCAAFLEGFREKLLKMEFMEMMKFLQNPPTEKWTKRDVVLLVEKAREMRRTHTRL